MAQERRCGPSFVAPAPTIDQDSVVIATHPFHPCLPYSRSQPCTRQFSCASSSPRRVGIAMITIRSRTACRKRNRCSRYSAISPR